jgi:hypothetical protein
VATNDSLWTYRNDVDPTPDWVGYSVHATDGDIGKIDELSSEVGRGSLIVDTGFWIFGKKRLIPASSVRSVDHNDETVFVMLTKEQIKDAPDYDSSRLDTPDYEEHGSYYGPFL